MSTSSTTPSFSWRPARRTAGASPWWPAPGRSPSAARRTGRLGRAGGWGYLLGDEGSAYALVMSALQEVAHAADGRGPPTVLDRAASCSRSAARRPMDLIPAVYRGGWDRTALAGLAPIVLDAAGQGDEVAMRIAAQGAHQLALTVAAAAMRLELPPDRLAAGHDGRHPAQFGTLSPECPCKGLDQLGIHADPVTLVHDPAEGGVRLARAMPRSDLPKLPKLPKLRLEIPSLQNRCKSRLPNTVQLTVASYLPPRRGRVATTHGGSTMGKTLNLCECLLQMGRDWQSAGRLVEASRVLQRLAGLPRSAGGDRRRDARPPRQPSSSKSATSKRPAGT